tara:strand:+ start:1365 stop:1655 length:291 start_codon:yes stop_codon:yes gene_type:complete
MNKTIKEHPDSYNGWTNYATWRVNLEILGDIDWNYEDKPNVEYLEDIVENCVFDNLAERNGLAVDYARAFLNEVNYHEILEHILDEIEIKKQTENE